MDSAPDGDIKIETDCIADPMLVEVKQEIETSELFVPEDTYNLPEVPPPLLVNDHPEIETSGVFVPKENCSLSEQPCPIHVVLQENYALPEVSPTMFVDVKQEIEVSELFLTKDNNTLPEEHHPKNYLLPSIPLKRLSTEDIEAIKRDLIFRDPVPQCPEEECANFSGVIEKSITLTSKEIPPLVQKCILNPTVPTRVLEYLIPKMIICTIPFKCSICGEAFENTEIFKFTEHFIKHCHLNPTTRFSALCPMCRFNGNCGWEVLQHVLDNHFYRDFEMKCFDCKFQNSNLMELNNHLIDQHFFEFEMCPICGKWIRERMEHVLKCHGVEWEQIQLILDVARKNYTIMKLKRQIEGNATLKLTKYRNSISMRTTNQKELTIEDLTNIERIKAEATNELIQVQWTQERAQRELIKAQMIQGNPDSELPNGFMSTEITMDLFEEEQTTPNLIEMVQKESPERGVEDPIYIGGTTANATNELVNIQLTEEKVQRQLAQEEPTMELLEVDLPVVEELANISGDLHNNPSGRPQTNQKEITIENLTKVEPVLAIATKDLINVPDGANAKVLNTRMAKERAKTALINARKTKRESIKKLTKKRPKTKLQTVHRSTGKPIGGIIEGYRVKTVQTFEKMIEFNQKTTEIANMLSKIQGNEKLLKVHKPRGKTIDDLIEEHRVKTGKTLEDLIEEHRNRTNPLYGFSKEQKKKTNTRNELIDPALRNVNKKNQLEQRKQRKTQSANPCRDPLCRITSVENHDQIHHSMICNLFNCPVCQHTFEDIFIFTEHFLRECAKEVTTYSASCPICPFQCISGLKLVQHVMEKHISEDIEMECFNCSFAHPKLSVMKLHVDKDHPLDFRMCHVCGVWFQDLDEFNFHLYVDHGVEYWTKHVNKNHRLELRICSFCAKCCQDLDEFNFHMYVDHGIEYWK